MFRRHRKVWMVLVPGLLIFGLAIAIAGAEDEATAVKSTPQACQNARQTCRAVCFGKSRGSRGSCFAACNSQYNACMQR